MVGVRTCPRCERQYRGEGAVCPVCENGGIKKRVNQHSVKTACPRGHPYSHVDSKGGRRCRICHADQERARRARRRA